MSDYKSMSIEERAASLVGDMPWVTQHLTNDQIADLKKQIAASMRAAVATAAMFLLAFLPSLASAGYPYHAPYKSAYVAPAIKYGFFHSPDYPGYYIRGYWDAAQGKAIYEAQLYTGKKAADGSWSYHPYYVPQIGSTVYGGSRDRYELSLKLGYKPAVHVPQSALKAPGPHDALALFPDPQRSFEIEAENAYKLETLAKGVNRDISIARLNADKEAELARIKGRTEVERWNAAERIMLIQNQQLAKFLEGGEATKDAGDSAAIPIPDDAVRFAVAKNCLACHGGAQGVKGGIDFRLPLTAAAEEACKDAIAFGEMPEEGVLSDDDRVTLTTYFRSRARASRPR
jgi:hypothetical protein